MTAVVERSRRPCHRRLESDGVSWNGELKQRYERIIGLLARHPEAYFSISQTPVFTPVLSIHRPSSEIVKCQVSFPGKNLHVYIKFFYRKEGSVQIGESEWLSRLENEVRITQNLFGHFKFHDEFSVPNIIAYFPEYKAVVMEESQGEQLLKIVSQKARGFPSQKSLTMLGRYFDRIGKWLAYFQEHTREDSVAILNLQEMLDYIDLRLKKLINSPLGIRKNFESDVKNYITDMIEKSNLSNITSCGVHSDLSLSNILVDNRTVTVLDFSMYKTGLCYNDVSYFCVRIEHLAYHPFFRRRTIDLMEKSFLNGYAPGYNLKNPLFKIYYMRHKINRLVDLSRYQSLKGLKKIYQIYQFYCCLKDVEFSLKNV